MAKQDTEIGKFDDLTREIDLNAGSKRFWHRRLTSLVIDQFNDSMPLPINQSTNGIKIRVPPFTLRNPRNVVKL